MKITSFLFLIACISMSCSKCPKYKETHTDNLHIKIKECVWVSAEIGSLYIFKDSVSGKFMDTLELVDKIERYGRDDRSKCNFEKVVDAKFRFRNGNYLFFINNNDCKLNIQNDSLYGNNTNLEKENLSILGKQYSVVYKNINNSNCDWVCGVGVVRYKYDNKNVLLLDHILFK